jgi:hypothetical protein
MPRCPCQTARDEEDAGGGFENEFCGLVYRIRPCGFTLVRFWRSTPGLEYVVVQDRGGCSGRLRALDSLDRLKVEITACPEITAIFFPDIRKFFIDRGSFCEVFALWHSGTLVPGEMETVVMVPEKIRQEKDRPL